MRRLLCVLAFTLAIEVVVMKVRIRLGAWLDYKALCVEVAMTMALAGACKQATIGKEM